MAGRPTDSFRQLTAPSGVPQTFAERLFARLQKANERLETRLAMMAVISRAVGVHQLLLLNFYPFLQKYIQPHQRDVTQILAILIQVGSLQVKPLHTSLTCDSTSSPTSKMSPRSWPSSSRSVPGGHASVQTFYSRKDTSSPTSETSPTSLDILTQVEFEHHATSFKLPSGQAQRSVAQVCWSR